MLIDLAIVTLISILYYLLCSKSRLINLVLGMLIIYVLCWAVGVNVEFATIFSEALFVVIVLIINVWIVIHGHQLANRNSGSRMNKFHHHSHNQIYAIRNRLNNFRLKNISDRFKATPQVYFKTTTNQIQKLDCYVDQHSHFNDLGQLMKSLKVIKSEIDNINYHLDLPMQINFPRGLKRITHQYHQIIGQYQNAVNVRRQNTRIVDVMSHGASDPRQKNVYLHVNLRFPYQRLTHDRVTHHVDLLTINQFGIFAFTLLNTNAKQLNVDQNDNVKTQALNSKRIRNFQSTINLKKRLVQDFNAVNDLIPNRFNITPEVAAVCTNSRTKINLADPKFKVLRPQDLNPIMIKLRPKLTPLQIKQLARSFRTCITRNSKYQWPVFNANAKRIISSLIWYQGQMNVLDHKFLVY